MTIHELRTIAEGKGMVLRDTDTADAYDVLHARTGYLVYAAVPVTVLLAVVPRMKKIP